MKHTLVPLLLLPVLLLAAAPAARAGEGAAKVVWARGGHSLPVNSVSWSPDGQLLASASSDGTVKLWAVATHALLATLPAGFNAVAKLSADGTLLALGSETTDVELRSVPDLALVATLGTHATTLDISPDGSRVATGFNQSVALWNAADGALIASTGQYDHVHAVAFSHDGALLGVGRIGISLLNVPDLSLHAPIIVGTVLSLAFSPDDARLVAANDASVKVYDVASQQLLATLAGPSKTVFAVDWSPSGELIAAGSKDFTARLWDAGSGALLHTLPVGSRVLGVDFSADGQTLATGDFDNQVRLFDADSGAALGALGAHVEAVRAIAWAPDGSAVVSGSDDHQLKLWSGADGSFVRAFDGLAGPVNGTAISADGQFVAAVSQYPESNASNLRVWRVDDGAPVAQVGADPNAVAGVVFSPDGQWLATADNDHTVRIWTAPDFGLANTLIGHELAVSALDVSADGHLLLSGSFDGTARLWDPVSGKTRQVFTNGDSVGSVALLPDGKVAATGGENGDIRLWNAGSGALLALLSGHDGLVAALDFTPDGHVLVSGGTDHTLRFWSVPDGAPLAVIAKETGPLSDGDGVRSLALSPDGQRVAYGRSDATVDVIASPLAGLGAGHHVLHAQQREHAADLDGNGIVDGADLALLLGGG